MFDIEEWIVIVGHRKYTLKRSVIHCRNRHPLVGRCDIHGLVGAASVADKGRTLAVLIDLVKQTAASVRRLLHKSGCVICANGTKEVCVGDYSCHRGDRQRDKDRTRRKRECRSRQR